MTLTKGFQRDCPPVLPSVTIQDVVEIEPDKSLYNTISHTDSLADLLEADGAVTAYGSRMERRKKLSG